MPLVGKHMVDSQSDAIAWRCGSRVRKSADRKGTSKSNRPLEHAAPAGHVEVTQGEGWSRQMLRETGGNLRIFVSDGNHAHKLKKTQRELLGDAQIPLEKGRDADNGRARPRRPPRYRADRRRLATRLPELAPPACPAIRSQLAASPSQ